MSTERALATRMDVTQRWRIPAIAALVLLEMFLASFVFNFPTPLSGWVNPVTYGKAAIQAAIVAATVLLLSSWSARAKIIEAWTSAMASYRWGVAVAVNLAAFAVLLVASSLLSIVVGNASSPPWGLFALYCAWLMITATTLALVAAPPSFWRWLAGTMPSQLGAAAISGVLLVLAGRLTLEAWDNLAGWTLRASHWVLTLFESDVTLDTDQHVLGVGTFFVRVLSECSGYEGIGLVTAFLIFYSWMMRHELRFPQALLLIPIGIATSLALNVVRIALLVSIGAHVSPEMALNGFHSQAGWIGFLALAVGLILLSTRAPFFSRAVASKVKEGDETDELLLALIVPFMALMATSIVAGLFAPHDHWLYPLKVLAVALALWRFRRVYSSFAHAWSLEAIAVGTVVGVAWIATDPAAARANPIGDWLSALPLWVALAWIICRGIGAIVLVPMAEELAFRGYLQRALVSRDFASVAQSHLTWTSFIVTALAFGAIHQRWLAAAVAGACYALVAYRTNRLSNAILAHAVSNAVIFLWAAATSQWTLL